MERDQDPDRRLFAGDGNEETLSLIEGVGPSPPLTRRDSKQRAHDSLLLILLVLSSVVILSASIFAAMRSKSTTVLVEVFGTASDLISYLASLVTEFIVRGRSAELKDKIEFGVGVFSTICLLSFGAKIVFQCYVQMRCALDNQFQIHHIPCSYLQARPDPYYVLMLEAICLCAYLPVFVVGCYYTDWDKYKPSTNISHASAILHLFCDVCQVVIVSIAAGFMMGFSGEAVYIDVFSSLICLFIMLVATTLMWSNYYFHWHASKHPDVLNSARGGSDDI